MNTEPGTPTPDTETQDEPTAPLTEQTTPQRAGLGFGGWFMVLLLPILLLQIGSSTAYSGGYSKACPKEAEQTAAAAVDSGLVTVTPTDINAITENTDNGPYVRTTRAGGCVVEYFSAASTVEPSKAQEALASNGWVVTKSTDTGITAIRLLDDTTWSVTYAADPNLDGTHQVTFRPNP